MWIMQIRKHEIVVEVVEDDFCKSSFVFFVMEKFS